jgi:hypothetical protein
MPSQIGRPQIRQGSTTRPPKQAAFARSQRIRAKEARRLPRRKSPVCRSSYTSTTPSLTGAPCWGSFAFTSPLGKGACDFVFYSRIEARSHIRSPADKSEKASAMNRAQRFVCSMVVLCAVACLFPPRKSSAGDDWLPITPEDLALKDNPASHGANAMILYRSSEVSEKYVNTDGAYVNNYLRIKIFTQEGTDQGNVEIAFFKESQDIKDLRARTIKPDGTIVNFEGKPFEKTIEKRSGQKFLAKTFTLPDVQPGCIIEYKYRVQYKPYLLYDNYWVLSGDLYTREGHFSILPFQSNYVNFPLYFRQFGLSTKVTPTPKPDGTYSLTVHDIPGIEDEAYMPPLKTVEARVEFYHLDEGTPANETQDHFWARTEKKWNDDIEHFINKKSVLDQEVARIVRPEDSPEIKLRKIYARVQQIRNLSAETAKSQKEEKQENLKKNSNVEDMLHHGYGYGRDINYLFIGLARAAGFDSAELLVAPRNSNFFYPQLQDASELGADIVWVRAGTQEYFLDPASSYFPFGVLPWNETNTNGIRLGRKPNDFVNVPLPSSADATVVRHADLTIAEDGLATGKLTVDFTGQWAALWRGQIHLQDDTGRKKTLEDEIKTWLPAGSNFELANLDDWDKTDTPLHIEGTMKLPAFGSSVGRRILIPATMFAVPENKAFQTAIRHNAVYFRFPNEEVDEVRFQGPAGYKVETVPPAKTLKPGAVVSYEISASQQGAVAEVKRKLVINGLMFPVEYYSSLRSFFNMVKSNDEVQIVLQNAESAKN